MATTDERVLALAVARGLLEPGEAHGADLAALVAAERLSDSDWRLLRQDLAELEAEAADHWSMEITAQTLLGPVAEGNNTEGTEAAPTEAAPARAEPATPSGDPSRPSKGFRQGGVFRATALERWGRFEHLALLGEGGMGRIFKATDPRLRREVALKLLRRDDPELIQRFLQEAQLQARVDHPNVCRVYEVGEWRGQPYIVMQFLRGETLQKAASRLSLEALLRHLVEVCQGVHAAHGVGLVHRDLKPANLMLDHSEDRLPHACVLDFGLARGTESQGLTETGRVMGTVSYMSPEQAQGQTALLDRRSDVYSLGATLYALLTGGPPFGGEGLACMTQIVKDDPLPLRAKVPTLPADLETVVLTCLQKDPRRRYATAKALGEDLQRILAGEPILARPATRLEKLMHWARKRKALVAASMVMFLSLTLFGGFAVRERLRARAQAAHAQRFAQAAERIEALARYLKLSPPHDLGPERRDLERRVARLAEEVRAEHSIAEAPGQYAIGRARLALGQPELAQTHLERARALGFDTPELRSALGRTLLELHQHALDEAWRIGQGEARKEAVARLQARATARIEPLLKSGAAASLIPLAYLEGQAAWVSGRWEEAVAKAKEAQVQAPWFYEAWLLEARALLSWGLPKSGPERAAMLKAAHERAQSAVSSAPCDVQALELVGRIGVICTSSFVSDSARREDMRLAVQFVVASLRTLDPCGEQAPILEAALLTAEAANARVAGLSGVLALRQALALLEPLVNEANPSFDALEGAMRAERYAAKFPEMGDPVVWLDRALSHGRRALELKQGHSDLAQELAQVAVWRISEGTTRNQPPWHVFEDSLQMILRELGREPGAKSLEEALGFLWGERAEYERIQGMDPRPSLGQSRQHFEAALKPGPAFLPLYGLANAALMQGQWEVVHAQPGALTTLVRADEAYLRAKQLAPFHSALSANLVEVFLWKGKAVGVATPQGARILDNGEAFFQEEAKRYPQVAILWLRGAQLAETQGHTQNARARIQRALGLDSHSPEIRLLQKELFKSKD